MSKLRIERVGGVAGFGLAPSHLRSHGELDSAALSDADRQRLDALFEGANAPASPSQVRDGFVYRITREGTQGSETVEVPEAEIPAAIARSVRDELI